jgi:hypothetical protein
MYSTFGNSRLPMIWVRSIVARSTWSAWVRSFFARSSARLVETLGHYQAGNVIGGQLMYPTVDDTWRPSAAYAAPIAAALDHPGVHVSIRLGGTIVLGVDTDGLASCCPAQATRSAAPSRRS